MSQDTKLGNSSNHLKGLANSKKACRNFADNLEEELDFKEFNEMILQIPVKSKNLRVNIKYIRKKSNGS